MKFLMPILLVLTWLGSTPALAQVPEPERRPDYLLERGYLSYNDGLYSDARRFFRDALNEMHDTRTEAYVRARFYEAMAALQLLNKDAEPLIEEFIRDYPTHPLANKAALALADHSFNFRRYSKAVEWYAKVDPYLLEKDQVEGFRFRKAYALFSTRKYADAKPEFSKLKSENSKEYKAPATYYLGHMYYEDEQYALARTEFEALREDSVFGAVVPFYLAQIYFKAGDYPGLIREGESLLSFPNLQRAAEIARLLAEASFRQAEYKKALTYFDRYAELKGVFGLDENYEAGFSAFQTKNYALAVDYLNKITSGSTETAQNAWFHLGLSQMALQNKEEALAAFTAAAGIQANARIREEANYNRVKLIYETGGGVSEGIDALEGFLEAYPDSPYRKEVQSLLANMLVQTRDYDRAMMLMQSVGMERPGMKATYQRIAYVRGVEKFQARDYEGALATWKESGQYPYNQTLTALAHFWSAEALYRLGRYQDVMGPLDAFRQVTGALGLSEYPRSTYLEGYTWFKLRDFQKSAAAFRRFASDKAEKDELLKTDALLRAADANFLTGGYLVAAGLYEDAVSRKSADADYALFQSGLCQGLSGKQQAKADRMERLLKNYPSSRLAPEALYELGNTQLEMGKNDAALSTYQTMATRYPDSRFMAASKVKTGLIYRNQQNFEKALGIFKGVVNTYPGTLEALEAQTFAKLTYVSMGKADEYAAWMESLGLADARKGELDTLVYTSGYESYLTGSYADAIRNFEQYGQRFPDGVYALNAKFYLAECLYATKEMTRAEGLFAEVAALPTNAYSVTAWERLADIRYAAKNFEGAYQAFGKLLELADSRQRTLKARIGLLECAAQTKRHEEVVNLSDALENQEELTAEQMMRSNILKARSLEMLQWEPQATQAWKALDKASNPAYQAEARYRLAERLYRDTKYKDAIDACFLIIEKLPGQTVWKNKALLLLARSYYDSGDLFQANYTLDFIISSNPDSDLGRDAQALKDEIVRREAEKQAALEAQKDLQNLVLPLEETEIPQVEDENEMPQ